MQNLEIIKKYALYYLSKYDSTKKNLERILKNKIRRITLEKKERFLLYNSLENIISDLEKKNFINDDNYANSKINNLSSQGKSKNYITSYLLQKGIDIELINENFYNLEINNPDWEEESVMIFIKKKKIDLENTEIKEKNIAKLARAGFNYSLIQKINK